MSDDDHAPGVEIGCPRDIYRRVRIESDFGKLNVLVTDGHLPYPYGREITGYEVASLGDTLAKAKSAGVTILVAPYQADSAPPPSYNSRAGTSRRSTQRFAISIIRQPDAFLKLLQFATWLTFDELYVLLLWPEPIKDLDMDLLRTR